MNRSSEYSGKHERWEKEGEMERMRKRMRKIQKGKAMRKESGRIW